MNTGQTVYEQLQKCIDLGWTPMGIEKCNVILPSNKGIALMERLENSQDIIKTISIHELFSKDSGIMEFVEWKQQIDGLHCTLYTFYCNMSMMTAQEKVEYFVNNAIIPTPSQTFNSLINPLMETTRESKIERIYEVISDKTLSPGCYTNGGVIIDIFSIPLAYSNNTNTIDKLHYEILRTGVEINENKGHPVMIGDVLDWLTVNDEYIPFDYFETFEDLDKRWGKLRKPLEEQSDECIDYLYYLIPTEDDLKRK